MNKCFIHILIITVLGILIYSNTFNVPFQFDDSSSIVENDRIRDLGNFIAPQKAKGYSLIGIPRLRYVGYLTFGLNYKLHGLDVTGYHIVNLFIHIVNALLVYSLVLLTFKTDVFQRENGELDRTSFDGPGSEQGLIAIFSALLFIVHPLQTQAVTYIVQRLASLATMFYLLSLVMYVKSRLIRSGDDKAGLPSVSNILFYVFSLISAVLAMKTKSISFTLPVIVTLYEFIFFRDKIKKRLLYLIPILLTMLIIPLSIIDMDVGKKPVGEIISDVSEVTRVESKLSRPAYLFTQFRVIMTYIRLIFFPVNQSLLYDYPKFHTFLNWQVCISFLFLIIIFSAGIYCLYSARARENVFPPGRSNVLRSDTQSMRLVSFGIFWFFMTLSVESGVIPILDVIFEHRVYLPSVGAFISIITFTFIIMNKLKNRFLHIKNVIMVVLVLVIGILSASAYSRNMVWKDNITLWEDVVAKSPGNVIGLNNMGNAYLNNGEIDKAVIYFKRAIAAAPGYAKDYYNLGFAFTRKGQFNEAIYNFKKAVAIKKDYAKAYNNLGIIYLKFEKLDRAAEFFKKTIELNPRHARAHYNIGIVFTKKGQTDRAIDYFKKAVRIDNDYVKAYYNLGLVYFMSGQIDRAIDQYLTALKLQPDYANAHHNLAVAYREKGLKDKAEKHFKKAELLGRP
jgi:tetratricopeptide (TPR) repeat protein